MAAILGLSDDAVRAACESAAQGEVVEPANFNAPAQVVIAGHSAAVTRACEAAKAAGAKRALPLAVSAPFHSSLLKPAGERLQQALVSVDLKSPSIALVNNVDVAIESEPAAVKDALVRQAYSPVRWVEVVQKMKAEGIDTVIEFGPGKVLTVLSAGSRKTSRLILYLTRQACRRRWRQCRAPDGTESGMPGEPGFRVNKAQRV